MIMNPSPKNLSGAVGGNERISGGPFGSKLTSSNYCKAGVPVIRGSNMEQNGRWLGGDFVFVSADRAQKEYKSNIARPGDVIVTQRGTLGQVSIVPNIPYDEYVISQSQMAISPNTSLANSLFIYYYLKSPQFCSYTDSQIIQTGVPHINLGILRNAPCAFPDITKQSQVASILGALDDKIDLNRRTNETLEAMARALFRDWFVDFGPTRAKIAGQTPYLAPELWELFPDRLDDEGKPEGWTNSTIGQEVDVVGGSTPSTKNPAFWNGDIFWATPKDLSSLRNPVLLETERKITEEGLSQISSGLLPVGTVLLSSRAPIGYTAIAQVPVAINQGFIAMVCQKRLSNTFVWLWTVANMETIHQKANGSTFQEISKANFRPIKTIVPTSDVLRGFDEKAGFWLEKIVSNETESRNLAQLRDLLLPKLMSGEIRIRDAEKMVADAL